MLYVGKVEGRGSVKMNSQIGAPVQLHTAAIAKVILAYAPDSRCDAAIAHLNFQRFTPSTIVTPATYRRELEKVRSQGWAVDDGEFEDYLNCIAVPIRDHRDVVRAGLSMTALRAIESLDGLMLNLPRLEEAAGQISLELGWDGKAGTDNDE